MVKPRSNCADCGEVLQSLQAKICMPCTRRRGAAARSAIARSRRIKRQCLVCGDGFEVLPSVAKDPRGRGKFCSRECDAVFRRLRTGPEHPLFKEKVQINCDFCGEVFEVKQSVARRPETRFCSRSCHGSWSIRAQGGRVSSLEVAVAAHLDSLGVTYEWQVRVGRFLVDFQIGDLVVEADGVYWHAQPKVVARDKRKDGVIAAKGLRLIRLPECEIKAGDFSRLDAALAEIPTAAAVG